MKFIVTIFALLVGVGVLAQKANYNGYQVLRVRAETQQQLDYLMQLGRPSSWPAGIRVLDFWHDPRRLGEAVDILTDNGSLLEEQLRSKGMSSLVLVRDVQSFLDENSSENAQRIAAGSNFTSTYHTYEEVIDYVYQLASTSGALISVSTIGVTYENRDIVTAKISSGGNNASNKEAIYLECGMHAREWISISTCIWIIDELTTLYGQSAETTSLVDRFDWFITPISNPDGYVFSWLNDRLWRKNRHPNSGSTCIGVDTNRNFDANFGGIGSSTDPCSETYGGPSAFSEVESRAMRDNLLNIGNKVKAVVSIHSDAQLWISPYGYTSVLPADYQEMERVMSIGTAAIEATYGTQYPYGPGSEVLYFTSGTTKDYVYDSLGIIHAYTLELRTTVFGFITPVTLIAPVATESWNGIQAMAKALF